MLGLEPSFTLNFWTSSGLATFPSDTHVWKNDGATETPKASAVMPVFARRQLLWITRKVPKSNTSKCWEYIGNDMNILQWERIIRITRSLWARSSFICKNMQVQFYWWFYFKRMSIIGLTRKVASLSIIQMHIVINYLCTKASFSSSVSIFIIVNRSASFSGPNIPPGTFLKNFFSTEAIVFTEKLCIFTRRPY